MSGLGRFRKGCAAAAACYCADTGSPGKASWLPIPIAYRNLDVMPRD